MSEEENLTDMMLIVLDVLNEYVDDDICVCASAVITRLREFQKLVIPPVGPPQIYKRKDEWL